MLYHYEISYYFYVNLVKMEEEFDSLDLKFILAKLKSAFGKNFISWPDA